jgi:hypothetical protein
VLPDAVTLIASKGYDSAKRPDFLHAMGIQRFIWQNSHWMISFISEAKLYMQTSSIVMMFGSLNE